MRLAAQGIAVVMFQEKMSYIMRIEFENTTSEVLSFKILIMKTVGRFYEIHCLTAE